MRKLLAHVAGDRLAHAWHPALSGLRRGEIGGLRWSDVDLDAGTLTIAHNRVSVNGAAMDSAPKTDRSARVLPLTPALTAALRRAAAVQKTERLALGPDYGAGEHVVCDQAGRSYHPDSLSDFWRALCTAGRGAEDPASRRPTHLRHAHAPPGRADRDDLGVARPRGSRLHDADLYAQPRPTR